MCFVHISIIVKIIIIIFNHAYKIIVISLNAAPHFRLLIEITREQICH
jgi:hypothetical protein